ncbi:MAG: DNA-processing protein DprA [Eubacteriales bacterium]|nr:DNA-processing protein DprA [Eubacteriales bacterium]
MNRESILKDFSHWEDIEVCETVSASYPGNLSASLKKPPLLYYKGNIEILNQKTVAIIGSRNVSENGKALAFKAGEIAAKRGFVVVNGLAIGCDSEALKGALHHNGKCAVILPGGLGEIVPRCNENLAQRILDLGGCLLSEYPPHMKPSRYTYVERDRLQSGVSNGILVIETQESSGTMHTVNYAKRQKKRIASYYSEIVGGACGNRVLAETGSVSIIKNDMDLECFLNILEENVFYQQLSFSSLL